MKSILLTLTLNWKCVLFTNFSWLSSISTSYPAQPGRGTETWLRRVSPTAAFPSVSSGKKIRLLPNQQQKQSFFKDHENEWLQWRPIQMRAFHSNENGLFCTHPILSSSRQNSVVISCPRAFWENSPERYLAFEEFVYFRVLRDNLGSL